MSRMPMIRFSMGNSFLEGFLSTILWTVTHARALSWDQLRLMKNVGMRRFIIFLMRAALVAFGMLWFGILGATAVALAIGYAAIAHDPEVDDPCRPRCWLPNPMTAWSDEEYRCKRCGARWYIRLNGNKSRNDYQEWTR